MSLHKDSSRWLGAGLTSMRMTGNGNEWKRMTGPGAINMTFFYIRGSHGIIVSDCKAIELFIRPVAPSFALK